MILPNCSTHVQNLDETLTDARRLTEILAGATALLLTPRRENALMAARASVLEAQAIAQTLMDRVERFFAVEAERQRNDHAQAAKHVAVQQ